ncbi:MAG: DUF2971 domain-containing protein [Alphaproteobacteria bacterium]
MEKSIWKDQQCHKGLQIWRYFKVERFLELLEKERIYFSSANEFSDTFEGAVAVLPPEIKLDPRYTEPDRLEQAFIPLKKYSKINCWHIEDHENSMMWEIYANRSKGVAVVSTVTSYIKSYTPYCATEKSQPETLFHGPVKYENLLEERLRPSSKERFFYKDRIFKHEQEYRFMISLEEASMWVDVAEKGIHVSFDPSVLIEEIILGPNIEPDCLNRIKLASERHQLKSKIKESRLRGKPKYI